MSVRFWKEIEFVGSLEDVRAMLLDPEFREEVALAAGAARAEVTVAEHVDGTHASIETWQPGSDFPAAARRFIGAELRIRQQEHWTAPDGGRMEAQIPGQPGHVRGTVHLEERGDVVVQTVDADIKVSIPFVGGQIEKAIGSAMGYVLKVQERVGNERLSG